MLSILSQQSAFCGDGNPFGQGIPSSQHRLARMLGRAAFKMIARVCLHGNFGESILNYCQTKSARLGLAIWSTKYNGEADFFLIPLCA